MRAYKVIGFAVLLALFSATAYGEKKTYRLSDLQGVWLGVWLSGEDQPTAAFVIRDEEIWLDFDSRYRPCQIVDGNVLTYSPGPGVGMIRREIILLEGDRLILENMINGQAVRKEYQRVRYD